jgi:hypothetical protein
VEFVARVRLRGLVVWDLAYFMDGSSWFFVNLR